MSNYDEKLLKAKQSVQPKEPEVRVGFFGDNDIKKIHESIAEMQGKVQAALQEQDTEAVERNTEQFKALKASLDELQQGFANGVSVTNLKELYDKFEKIKFDPVINVPTPIANVQNKIVVQDWKKEYIFSDSDKSESTTYVGFVNIAGGWYIERVTKSKTSDKARFVFGKGDYVSNWGKRLQQDYKYLYEAIDAR